MRCKYLSRDGRCTGKYSGYACIKRHCAYSKGAQNCQYHESSGDYCLKYGRFGCVGRESCKTLTDYLEAVAEEG